MILGLMELLVLILLVSVPLLVISLVDVLKHQFPGNDKTVWLLVIIFFPLLGPILYFIIGKKTRLPEKPAS